MPPRRGRRDPRTKEEFLDRMLRYDFDGDIRHVGAEAASIVRIGANALRLTFPATGVVFDLLVCRPRAENLAARERYAPPQRASERQSFVEEDDEPEIEPVVEAPRRRAGSRATSEKRSAAN